MKTAAKTNGRAVERLDPPPARPAESGATLYRHPPHAGDPRAPVRTFRIAEGGEAASVHEGRGLALDDVLAFHAEPSAPLGAAGPPALDSPGWDTVVFDGARAVALVRKFGDKGERFLVVRLDGPEPPPGPPPPGDAFQDMIHHPAGPGFERAPIRSYRVIQEGRFLDVHEGRGLTVDRVLAEEARARDPADTHPDDLMNTRYDLAVFEGPKLAAVLHAFGGPGGACMATRFEGGVAETSVVPVPASEPEGRPRYGG